MAIAASNRTLLQELLRYFYLSRNTEMKYKTMNPPYVKLLLVRSPKVEKNLEMA